MDRLHSEVVESVNLGSHNLVKTFEHGEKHITGWNRYCKKKYMMIPERNFLYGLEMIALELVKPLR